MSECTNRQFCCNVVDLIESVDVTLDTAPWDHPCDIKFFSFLFYKRYKKNISIITFSTRVDNTISSYILFYVKGNG